MIFVVVSDIIKLADVCCDVLR